MFTVELINSEGCVLDSFSIDTEELTLDDIAERNWWLANGDCIVITEN